MGKIITFLVVVAAVGLTSVYGLHLITRDQGRLIGHALSKPDANGEVQLQVVGGLADTMIDPPQQVLANGKPDWNDWVDTHYRLRDPAGNPVDMSKGNGFRSKNIKESDMGTAELIALAQLKAGDTYTLTFIPEVGRKEQYSREIEAVATDFKRVTFEPSY